MHILMYKGNRKEDYCSVMGIFFMKKQAKKARDKLIAWDKKKYPCYPDRSEQTKSCYKIVEAKPFHVAKHKDPFEGK
jgi:hypothetical protein